jgi:hypothetical protein
VHYWVGNLIIFSILLKTNFTKKKIRNMGSSWTWGGLGFGGLGDSGWACKIAYALPGGKFNPISYFVENKFYQKIRNMGSSWTWGGLGDPRLACKVVCALSAGKFNHISYFVENKFYKKIRNMGSSWT